MVVDGRVNPFAPLRRHGLADGPGAVYPARSRTAPRRSKKSEQEEQKKWVGWARARGLVFNHQNNGASSKARRIHLHQMGCAAGAPDILVFNWLPRYPEARGLALEFKSARGKQSSAQQDWARWLGVAEWIYRVVRSAEEAKEVCREVGLVG